MHFNEPSQLKHKVQLIVLNDAKHEILIIYPRPKYRTRRKELVNDTKIALLWYNLMFNLIYVRFRYFICLRNLNNFPCTPKQDSMRGCRYFGLRLICLIFQYKIPTSPSHHYTVVVTRVISFIMTMIMMMSLVAFDDHCYWPIAWR